MIKMSKLSFLMFTSLFLHNASASFIKEDIDVANNNVVNIKGEDDSLSNLPICFGFTEIIDESGIDRSEIAKILSSTNTQKVNIENSVTDLLLNTENNLQNRPQIIKALQTFQEGPKDLESLYTIFGLKSSLLENKPLNTSNLKDFQNWKDSFDTQNPELLRSLSLNLFEEMIATVLAGFNKTFPIIPLRKI